MSPSRAKSRLAVATCQLLVGQEIRKNAETICSLIDRATDQGAEVVHFPECALSGYGSSKWPLWDGFDWRALDSAVQRVRDCCSKRSIWAVVGSAWLDSEVESVRNALLVVDDAGKLVGRYNKRHCSENDLKAFSPGTQPLVFDISGVRCGASVCLDWSFPEVFAAYADAGVELVFHSAFSAGGSSRRRHLHADVAIPLMQGHAFANSLYISVSNCSLPQQWFPSVWVKRSGRIGGCCRLNTKGLTLNNVSGEAEARAFCERVRNFRAEARRRGHG